MSYTLKQYVNLYEKDVAHGTLCVSVDDSKFLIKFYESIKVELLIDAEETQPIDADGTHELMSAKGGEQKSQKDSEEFGKWGDYIDLSEHFSNQGVPQTSQKIVKIDDGQSLATSTPADHEYASYENNPGPVDTGSSKTSEMYNVNDHFRHSERVNISNVTAEENENLLRNNMNDKNASNCSVQSLQSLYDMNCPSGVTNKDSSNKGDNVMSTEGVPKSEMNPGDIYFDDVPVTFDTDSNAKDNKPTAHAHSCKSCHATFDSLQALREHKKVSIPHEFRCDDCYELFQYRAFLDVHKKSNHDSAGASLVYKDDQYWYSCDSCDTLVDTIIKLQVHNLVHTGEGVFRCCWCPQQFIEKSELNKHIKVHKLSGITRCRWCNKWFDDKGALAIHKLNCKVIKCSLCETVFPNKTSRNQHYKDIHPNDILKCQLCSHMFSSQEDLEDHMKKHSKVKKMQCPLCGLFFSKLKKHMIGHKNIEDFAENEFFYCDKCPAKFTKQASFSRHQKNHLGDRPYQCPYCPKSFTNCGLLRGHVKRHKSVLPATTS